jgi:aryl-alcohol dehydrogenase-like predicted oxidoreductase
VFTRRLGRSGIEVSALALGTARLGGLGWANEEQAPAPDSATAAEGVRLLQQALDAGITFFDTADTYGCGYAESLVGRAFAGRHDVVIATKFGGSRAGEGVGCTPQSLASGAIRGACEASLRRLSREAVDLYLLHRRDLALDDAVIVRDTLEALVAEGKIRFYGWSTDDVERASFFAAGPHCTAIEHRLNVFQTDPQMVALCERERLASIGRVPLLSGVLTGRLPPGGGFPAEDPRRLWSADPAFQDLLRRAEALRPWLTAGGRSFVQGAIAWIWARSAQAVPIPGCRTLEQLVELVGAAAYGPLDADVMAAIEVALAGA